MFFRTQDTALLPPHTVSVSSRPSTTVNFSLSGCWGHPPLAPSHKQIKSNQESWGWGGALQMVIWCSLPPCKLVPSDWFPVQARWPLCENPPLHFICFWINRLVSTIFQEGRDRARLVYPRQWLVLSWCMVVVTTQAASSNASPLSTYWPLALGRTCTWARPKMIAIFMATPSLKWAECPNVVYLHTWLDCADGAGGRTRLNKEMISKHKEHTVCFGVRCVSSIPNIVDRRHTWEQGKLEIGRLDTKERAQPPTARISRF